MDTRASPFCPFSLFASPDDTDAPACSLCCEAVLELSTLPHGEILRDIGLSVLTALKPGQC